MLYSGALSHVRPLGKPADLVQTGSGKILRYHNTPPPPVVNDVSLGAIFLYLPLMNALGAMTSPEGIHPSCSGHFHLPEAFMD